MTPASRRDGESVRGSQVTQPLIPTEENDSNVAHLDELLEQARVGAISRVGDQVGDPVQATEAVRSERWVREHQNFFEGKIALLAKKLMSEPFIVS